MQNHRVICRSRAYHRGPLCVCIINKLVTVVCVGHGSPFNPMRGDVFWTFCLIGERPEFFGSYVHLRFYAAAPLYVTYCTLYFLNAPVVLPFYALPAFSLNRSRIHERTIALRFSGRILRVLRLEVSVYNVYIRNQFQTPFA
jgi:hypothetical protein